MRTINYYIELLSYLAHRHSPFHLRSFYRLLIISIWIKTVKITK